MNRYTKIAKKWSNKYQKVQKKLHKNDMWGSFQNRENKRSKMCKKNYEYFLNKAMQSGDYSLL